VLLFSYPDDCQRPKVPAQCFTKDSPERLEIFFPLSTCHPLLLNIPRMTASVRHHLLREPPACVYNHLSTLIDNARISPSPPYSRLAPPLPSFLLELHPEGLPNARPLFGFILFFSSQLKTSQPYPRSAVFFLFFDIDSLLRLRRLYRPKQTMYPRVRSKVVPPHPPPTQPPPPHALSFLRQNFVTAEPSPS